MLTFKINKNETAYEVTKCDKKAAGLVTIPDTYSGKPVVGIAKEAFRECVNVTDVIIPDSIEKIGTRAFYGCAGLTNIVIPDSLKRAGRGIFAGCTSLTGSIRTKNIITIAKCQVKR